ncbi:MAG TPA: 4Fe-4S single cluster domain-containing protein [Terriglobia bacterium]|nr:4Fe-4S single cluster domain-containing protein [Terriglobia bacterium]
MLLHALIPASRANGPGLRAVVFFQGCSLGCKNCWNQNSHAFVGAEVSPDTLAGQVLKVHADYVLEGVTFSGGEPMQQAECLPELMKRLRAAAPSLSFEMFSGYTEGELERGDYRTRQPLPVSDKQLLWQEIRSRLDFAVLGRFNQAQPGNAPLRTSRIRSCGYLARGTPPQILASRQSRSISTQTAGPKSPASQRLACLGRTLSASRHCVPLNANAQPLLEAIELVIGPVALDAGRI